MLSAIVKNRSLTAQSRMAPASEIAAQSVEIVLPSSKDENSEGSTISDHHGDKLERQMLHLELPGRPNYPIDTHHRFQAQILEGARQHPGHGVLSSRAWMMCFVDMVNLRDGVAIGGMLEHK